MEGSSFLCVQVQTDISVDTKQQTLQGVAFPIGKDAAEALKRFREKKINYVQLVSFFILFIFLQRIQLPARRTVYFLK